MLRALAAAAVVLLSTLQAHAMKIQELTTKAGIRVWLVEERAVPLIAMRFAFEGGSAQDPDGKEGLAKFLTGMMDEGAGDLDSQAFQKRMEETAMRLSFDDSKDHLYGSFETLTENRRDAVALLKMVINKPRFDQDAHDRVRVQFNSSIMASQRNPDRVATEQWYKLAFPNHPYGRPSSGTIESLKAVQPADLEAYRKAIFAKDSLKIVLVGDINAIDASALIDDVFGALPAKGTLKAVPKIAVAAKGKVHITEMPFPQSVAVFGTNGIDRKDKDFMPAFVLNHLLGGGGFSSRLMEQVREKRGLAYGVYSSLQPFRSASIMIGSVATKNEQVSQSIDVIRAEMKAIADAGPTQTELDSAKSYLIGSFPLRFDTNAKIASQLLYFFQEDFGIDYVDRRNKEVADVMLEDVKRVAKRIYNADDLFISIVGKPEGIKPNG